MVPTTLEAKVRIGTSESGTVTLKEGKSQGSASPPPLFVIYINDISKIDLELEIIAIADDTCNYSGNWG